MKTIGLDIGDTWVGVALSDSLGITCKPLDTIHLNELPTFLKKIVPLESVNTVVIGNPITLKGTNSDQTAKTIAIKEQLALEIPHVDKLAIQYVLWDERFSSKRAQAIQKNAHSKEQKRKEHAIAAAFILQGYLDHKAFSPSLH